MKTQNLQIDKFDHLATELLRSDALRDDQIESIASKSDLFSSVRARIIADSVSQVGRITSIALFQRSVILTAAAAIIVVAVLGTMMLARRPVNRTVAERSPVAPQGDQNLVGQAKHVDPLRSQEIVEPSVRTPMPHVEKAMDYRPVAVEKRPTGRSRPESEEQPPQFFALAGLRPSEVAVDGSRIIRVELPRASLVTLGVNVPLDSDKQLIRTDLLVGPDGVPRAIRLVE